MRVKHFLRHQFLQFEVFCLILYVVHIVCAILFLVYNNLTYYLLPDSKDLPMKFIDSQPMVAVKDVTMPRGTIIPKGTQVDVDRFYTPSIEGYTVYRVRHNKRAFPAVHREFITSNFKLN